MVMMIMQGPVIVTAMILTMMMVTTMVMETMGNVDPVFCRAPRDLSDLSFGVHI